MFIPDYQIHNILKDFTLQLKNGYRRPQAGCQLESVVNKVSGTIMRRVVHLSEEEARRLSRNPLPEAPPRTLRERAPVRFDYHTIDRDHRKQRQSLALENSAHLINRFHSLVDDRETDPTQR
jgi:hypothetical protein